jgi:hypothetical protein
MKTEKANTRNEFQNEFAVFERTEIFWFGFGFEDIDKISKLNNTTTLP